MADLGVTDLWLSPDYKGIYEDKDAGYGVYDLYEQSEILSLLIPKI